MPAKTQAELLAEHRAELDAEYLAKWPQGQFVLQIRRSGTHGLYWNPRRTHGLYWNPRRSTSHIRYRGIGTTDAGDEPGIYQHNHQNNSFGTIRKYDTFEKLIAAAERAGFPTDLIAAFSERYQKRASEGFTV